jgi:hypothetical protein
MHSSAPRVFGDYEAFIEEFFETGLGDGMPVAPPTVARVAAALEAMRLDREVLLGTTPAGTTVTAVDVAVRVVLAGCRAEYAPVVLAAVRAFFDDVDARAPRVADSIQAVIVNGPIRNQIGLNCRDGVLGPGWRANATIGRALRLVVSDAFGVRRASSFGDPGQYTFCVGEDEEGSQWSPLHVDRGFRPDESTVTVHSCMTYKEVKSKSMSPKVVCDRLQVFMQGKASATNWYGESPLTIVILIGHELRRRIAPTWSKQELRDRLFEGIVADVESPLHRVNIASPDDLTIVAAGGVAYDTAWVLVSPDARPFTRGIVGASSTTRHSMDVTP